MGIWNWNCAVGGDRVGVEWPGVDPNEKHAQEGCKKEPTATAAKLPANVL